MKKIILSIICVFFFLLQSYASDAVDSFYIKGKISGKRNGIIYLRYPDSLRNDIIDSSIIINGKFWFKGHVDGFVKRVCLRLTRKLISDDDKNTGFFSLENAVINVDVQLNNFQHLKVKGVKIADSLDAYFALNTNIYNKIKECKQKLLETNNADAKSSIDSLINLYRDSINKSNLEYCKKYPNSALSPLLLFDSYYILSYEDFSNYFSLLSSDQQKSYSGRLMNKLLTDHKLKTSQIGTKAPLFETIGFDNKNVSLKEINKDHVILLEFWASWCGPCRASHHDLRNLYLKYNPKGLEIISIADDLKDENKWLNAIQTDSMFIWKNILRTEDRKPSKSNPSDIQEMYHVGFLPTKILIDKNGNIIGRFDEVDEIDNKLAFLFN